MYINSAFISEYLRLINLPIKEIYLNLNTFSNLLNNGKYNGKGVHIIGYINTWGKTALEE